MGKPKCQMEMIEVELLKNALMAISRERLRPRCGNRYRWKADVASFLMMYARAVDAQRLLRYGDKSDSDGKRSI